MRADLRRLADDRAVDMIDDAAARAHQIARMFGEQAPRRRRASADRTAGNGCRCRRRRSRRASASTIACKRDVGIRMAGKRRGGAGSARRRARRPSPRRRRGHRSPCRCARSSPFAAAAREEIGLVGQLLERRIARRRWRPPARRRGPPAHRRSPRARRATPGARRGSRHSRRPAASARAPPRRAAPARRASAPPRARLSATASTGTAPAALSSAPSSRSITAAGTNGRAASWISTRAGAGDRAQARPAPSSRRVAPPSTGSGSARVPIASRVERLLPRADHHLHAIDRRMRRERVDRVRQHAAPADRAILLGHVAARSLAAAGGDDQRDGRGARCGIAARLAEPGLARQPLWR